MAQTTPRSIRPITWPPEPQLPAPIRIPASYDKGPQRPPKTAPKMGLPRNQDKEPLIVVPTKSQSVHIQIGDKKLTGQESWKSKNPKYAIKESVSTP